MEFGIENCTILVMESGKQHMTGGIELPKSRKIKRLREKETYLGILETDTIKKLEMKEKLNKDHLGRTRKRLEKKLYSRNFT